MSAVGPRIASGTAKAAYGSPLYLNPAMGTGLRLARKVSRTGPFVMFFLSCEARATYRGRTWEAEGSVQAHGVGCPAGEEPRPDALADRSREAEYRKILYVLYARG